MHDFDQTPDEQFAAVGNLRDEMEQSFVSLGGLLATIKRTKSFRLKHYKTFKAFVENEFNIGSSFASKLIGIYELYIEQLSIDEGRVEMIGIDKLSAIKTFVKDGTDEEAHRWIDKAQEMETADLKEEIREIRAAEREKKKTMKDILIEQHREIMATRFNCGQKEVDFKIALYFQDIDMKQVVENIKVKQRRFEQEVLESNEVRGV